MSTCAAAAQMKEHALLYALGTLTQNEARAFEDHLADGCNDCEAELRASEQVASGLAYEAAEVAPPANVFERLMNFVSEAPRPAPVAPAAPIQLTTVYKDEGQWFESSPGVLVKRLFNNPETGTFTSLIKMLPGSIGTLHRHPGIEECIILEGDFHVAGSRLGPGDYHIAGAGSIHEKPYSIGGALLVIIGPPYERL
ncbi:MAG: cupin domain-containing protein [Blastocatellia bacterium]